MTLQVGRSQETPVEGAEITVVIVSGACCFPPLKALDDEARRIVDAAIVQAGVPARVVSMSTSQAYYGGLPKALAEEGKKVKNEVGITAFPAVAVNFEVVSYGVPSLDAVVAALNKAARPGSSGEPAIVAAPAAAQTGDVR